MMSGVENITDHVGSYGVAGSRLFGKTPNEAIIPEVTKTGRDPKGMCGANDPFDMSGGLGNGRGYHSGRAYGGAGHSRTGESGFSLGGFVRDVLTGAVVGGLGSAGFYGAGKAVEVLRGSVVRAVGGQRRSKFLILTDDEIAGLKEDIRAIGADERIFRFNEGYQTGFSESSKLILVRGDVLPDLSSNHPRDLMSSRAVLAHEYYGHRYFDELYGVKNPLANSWNDEFRASYFAALKAPNLSDIDRHHLMADAVERAREAGVTIKLTDEIRRVLYGF